MLTAVRYGGFDNWREKMKNTVATFREAKGHEKLVMLTAYDYSVAR